MRWFLWRIVPGVLGGVAALVALIGLGACQASVEGARLDRGDLSILCGSSSNRLLPECKEFYRRD